MKPNSTWIEDWQLEEAPSREGQVGHELLTLFLKFWEAEGLDEKSKKTRYRYSSALHALGGYLFEKAVLDDDAMQKTTEEILDESINPYDGPLISLDNETWQNEIDMVCRKLYKYRKKNR